MTASGIRLSDLARDPGAVARAQPAWVRGDREEAMLATLAASARDLHARAYTLWAWSGQGADGAPAWALPVPVAAALAYRPRGPAQVLARCLRAAVDAGAGAGADPAGIRLEDWRGYTCLALPGADEELAELILAEAHPAAARVALAPAPAGVVLGGAALALEPLSVPDGDGVSALAHAVGAHPVRVALVLAARGLATDDPSYPPGLVGSLREWGLSGHPPPAAAAPAPSLAVEDDPCPRRRHARKLLRRLLRMGKVGRQYHTSFDHVYRGAAADARHDALAVGEALLRAELLGEKPSVGQRHVYLRREALREIHALIDRGETDAPALTEIWTAPPPALAAPLAGPAPPPGRRAPTASRAP